jgi:excisionase family DNA binding protein
MPTCYRCNKTNQPSAEVRRTGRGHVCKDSLPCALRVRSEERVGPRGEAGGVRERLLTARKLAVYLGVSPGTVLDWFEAGRLPGFRLGGRKGGPVRFRLSEAPEAKNPRSQAKCG